MKHYRSILVIKNDQVSVSKFIPTCIAIIKSIYGNKQVHNQFHVIKKNANIKYPSKSNSIGVMVSTSWAAVMNIKECLGSIPNIIVPFKYCRKPQGRSDNHQRNASLIKLNSCHFPLKIFCIRKYYLKKVIRYINLKV